MLGYQIVDLDTGEPEGKRRSKPRKDPRTGNRGRVNLTLSKETEKVLRKFAELNEMRYATAIAHLLNEIAPGLHQFNQTMSGIKAKEADAVDGFRSMLGGLQRDLSQVTIDFNDAVKESRKKKESD